MNGATEAFFETRFPHDFSHVRLHTDVEASASAREVDAKAYTWGQHIVFGEGQYAPDTASGMGLLAHELAHTVQQRHVSGLPNSVSKPGDALEQSADAVAATIMAGLGQVQLESTSSNAPQLARSPLSTNPLQGFATQPRSLQVSLNEETLRDSELEQEIRLIREWLEAHSLDDDPEAAHLWTELNRLQAEQSRRSANPAQKKATRIRAQKRTMHAGVNGPKSKRLLVLLWDPHRKDQGPTLTPQEIDTALFGGQSSSLRQYYLNQSGGKAVIDKVAVLGWYGADKPADHYWNHPANANDGFTDGHVEKWAEALRDADKSVDFSSFDDDGDGKLSADELGILIVIPQASSDGFNRLAEGPNHAPLMLDGVQIGEIAEVYLPSPVNDGVIRHELGHLLFDFPDLYGNTTYPNNGAGAYSLMDITRTDAQIDAPHRIQKGWVAEQPITHSGAYALGSVEDSRQALTYTRPGSRPREYFVIEKRAAGKYDRDLKDYGIVIWRVVDDGNPESLYRFKPGGKEAWPTNQALAAFELGWSDGTASELRLSVDPKRPDEVQVEVPMPQAAPAARAKPEREWKGNHF